MSAAAINKGSMVYIPRYQLFGNIVCRIGKCVYRVSYLDSKSNTKTENDFGTNLIRVLKEFSFEVVKSQIPSVLWSYCRTKEFGIKIYGYKVNQNKYKYISVDSRGYIVEL